MADQVESRDIEDLLASIRRLVSEDDGTSGAAVRAVAEALDDAGQVQTTEAVAVSDEARLVLTPQLRVTEPEDPYQMIRQLAEEDQVAVAEEVDVPETTSIAEVLAAVDALDEVAQGDIAEDEIPQPTFQHTARARAEDAVADADDIEAPFIDVAEQSPEQSPEDIVTTFRRLDRRKARAERQAARDAEEIVEETLVAQAGADAPEEEAAAVADDPVEVELMAPEAPHEASSEASGEAPVEGLLDEEQLREIIADVVREELAGHLGERITRNVRKLVRRELRQIMASEEFD